MDQKINASVHTDPVAQDKSAARNFPLQTVFAGRECV
jgi:hypothetical protein